jgi:hemerythrin-like metal-binding protein
MLENQRAAGALIIWTDDFAVGHAALDTEHRALVDLINSIHAAECARQSFSQIRPTLDALIRRAIEHFQHENSVLRSIGKSPLPDAEQLAFIGFVTRAAIEEHALGHGRTIARLNSIIKSKSQSKPNIGLDLKDWFVEHAVKYDGHLKPVFRALNAALRDC